MAINYAYNYAYIDPETNMCMEVRSSTSNAQGNYENWVEIPVCDEDYVFKYYNWDNGKFYYDEAYTEEYISPIL